MRLPRDTTGLLLVACLVALALPLAVFAATGWFTRYASDDYCTAGIVLERGFFGAQEYWYTSWSDDRTPWYPSARLLRQREPGNWAGVLADASVARRGQRLGVQTFWSAVSYCQASVSRSGDRRGNGVGHFRGGPVPERPRDRRRRDGS